MFLSGILLLILTLLVIDRFGFLIDDTSILTTLLLFTSILGIVLILRDISETMKTERFKDWKSPKEGEMNG